MGRKRTHYTPEFRSEAVSLFRRGDKHVGKLATDIGIFEPTLHRWAKQADIEMLRIVLVAVMLVSVGCLPKDPIPGCSEKNTEYLKETQGFEEKFSSCEAEEDCVRSMYRLECDDEYNGFYQ